MTPRAASNPLYDFLAHPPTQPSELRSPSRTISRRRSSTKTAISAWVAGVLPGSPQPATPPDTPTFSVRPSLLGSPHSARQHSISFPLFADTATHHTKVHNSDFGAPTYACTVVPLPVPTQRARNSDPDDMKLSRLTLMRQHKSSVAVAGSQSPTPSKKRGFLRFLRPSPHFRSVRTRHPSPPPHARRVPSSLPPSSSPTTVAFRIAHQKRALYAERGALPLPMDSEIALMQFVDGGSRADAVARLGGTYKDAAGVIYADEEEAEECLPLLLSAESTLASSPPSPLTPTSRPPAPALAPALHLPAQVPAASSLRALLSIPARGGGASMPGYLHTSPPSLPSPFHGIGSKTPSVETVLSRGRRRKRPAPLALHLSAHRMGFEDSFMPSVVIETPSPSAREVGVASQ